jgi:CRP-like cAMP-binding protein
LFFKEFGMQYSPVIDSPSASPVAVRRGEVVVAAHGTGPVWRVLSGAFRLDCVTDAGQSLVHLALPGDWVGVEALCGAPYACTVTALVDSEVQAEAMVNLPRMEALSAAVRQQQRQMLDMVPLRSGTVGARLTHLLSLLARRCDGNLGLLSRQDMPRLKQTAQIIDTAVETVCRELNRLLPARPRRASTSARPAWRQADGVFAAAV